jgi:microcystin-dependent protein
MSQPYVGEIRMFGGNFPPNGWALCQGQILSIAENNVLFQLIGTTYGGNGQSTFALPDLRGRIPVDQGTGFVIGQMAGTETVTLTTQQIPSHSHIPQANTSATGTDPTNTVVAGVVTAPPAWFATGAPTLNMAGNFLGLSGGNQPHDNMMPYLAVNFIISLFGVFPSQF